MKTLKLFLKLNDMCRVACLVKFNATKSTIKNAIRGFTYTELRYCQNKFHLIAFRFEAEYGT